MKRNLNATYAVAALMLAACGDRAGTPHPQMFKWLQDMTRDLPPQTNARDYSDCSTGRCERGVTWDSLPGTVGVRTTWVVITEMDGKPARAARMIQPKDGGRHIVGWNFDKGTYVEVTPDGHHFEGDIPAADGYRAPFYPTEYHVSYF
jgi:hypothetical protein